MDSCEGAGICMDVTSNEDGWGQLRELLVGCGDDDDRCQRFAQAINHVLEHRCWTERKGILGGSHATAVATTKDNSADGQSRLLLHMVIVDVWAIRRIGGRG